METIKELKQRKLDLFRSLQNVHPDSAQFKLLIRQLKETTDCIQKLV